MHDLDFHLRAWSLALATALGLGCGAGEADVDNGSSDITAGGGPCTVTNQLTGKEMSAADLAQHDDPIAKLILGTPSCPETFSEIAAKLRKLDTGNCADEGDGKLARGVITRLISERAAETKKPDKYRSVTSRDCGGRPQFGLFMSTFGLSSSGPLNEQFVEIIARDTTKGVFDYYSQEGGRWTFFGSSTDFLDQGYTCNNGACVPKAASKARCAACHVGGGLNMKELQSPWVFWDIGSLPGAKDTVAKFPDVLGAKGSAIELERRVTGGNADWVKARVKFLKAKGAAEVLRPLFCTVDMNLTTPGNDALTVIPPSLFVDHTWDVSQSVISVEGSDYVALRDQFGQKLPTGVKDTPFAFIYPDRSVQDRLYQAELLTQKIVDDDLLRDILHVDFTRATYSKARCDLLDFAPKLSGDELTADAIRKGFITNLGGKPGAAATLLANLSAQGDQAAHQADIDTFFKACGARPKKDLLSDAMKYASHVRRVVSGVRDPVHGGIIEFPETLPTDNIPDSDAFFDPKTCVLK